MKHLLAIAPAALLLAATLASCESKKSSDTIIAQEVVETKVTAPVKMQDYKQESEVDWNGGKTVCVIHRMADDSLAMVSDERGQKFVDNRVKLEIRRADGTVVLKKEFTKATFSPWLDNDYRATGIVEGFVFDRVDGQRLRFAASVCHPQTDEYIPLVVIVAPNGSITIERDTQMDTSGEDHSKTEEAE